MPPTSLPDFNVAAQNLRAANLKDDDEYQNKQYSPSCTFHIFLTSFERS
jgi:hypothetical protein